MFTTGYSISVCDCVFLQDREQTVIVENNSSTVKQRLMSLFQPSKIESSMLTAMFVIIGWKMFIKQ